MTSAVEGLRNLLHRESAKVARHDVVRLRQFSERITDLMTRYTNEHLTSAEVIAQLVELAREVAAEDDRGRHSNRRCPTTSSRSTTPSATTNRRWSSEARTRSPGSLASSSA